MNYCVSLGADSLCSRLTEKINSNDNHKLVLAHMPLLMVCLEGLGKLAQKFPNIASTSIYCLRDFLITPSPILLKLHKHFNEKETKDNVKCNRNQFSIRLTIDYINFRFSSSERRQRRRQIQPIGYSDRFRETTRHRHRKPVLRSRVSAQHRSGLRSSTGSERVEPSVHRGK